MGAWSHPSQGLEEEGLACVVGAAEVSLDPGVVQRQGCGGGGRGGDSGNAGGGGGKGKEVRGGEETNEQIWPTSA